MAKKVETPKGMKCYEKIGGGTFRVPNRIIKSGQKFFATPEQIPAAFKDTIREVPADKKAVVLYGEDAPKKEKKKDPVKESFKMEKALDKEGNEMKKGNGFLYNVVGEDGKAANEKPLRKNKATELLETLNV